MPTVVVTSQTGGDGKSVLCANMTSAVAMMHKADYDAIVLAEANAMRSTLRTTLAPQAEIDWPTSIRSRVHPHQILRTVEPDWLQVQFLPGPIDPAAWTNLRYRDIRRSLADLVQSLPERTWLQIDTGQMFETPVHAAAIAEADCVIVVTRLSNPRIDAMEDWWRSLERFRDEQAAPDRARLTVVMALKRSTADNAAERRLKRFLGARAPLFTMAALANQDPFPNDELPILAGQTGADIRALVDAAGCQLVFLPPYSPDFNPLELVLSKRKTRLRRLAARTQEAVEAAIAEALTTVTVQDARKCFRHCGYPASDQ